MEKNGLHFGHHPGSEKNSNERLNVSGISYKALIIASLLLFIAVAPMPYGYYTFVKIVICGGAGFICYRLFKGHNKTFWPWAWGTVAILFNPFIPILIIKEIWMFIDAATGILFLIAAYQSYKSKE